MLIAYCVRMIRFGTQKVNSLLISYHICKFIGSSFFKVNFINYAVTLVPFFSPLYSTLPFTPPSHQHTPSSLNPWVIDISSLASPFSILFLTSHCLFCTYHLYFLFPVSFPPFSPLALPTDNPPCDVHFCDSVPVLVVCLVYFCFFRFCC